MAKSQRDLNGWKYVLEETQPNKDPQTPSRRSRRSAPRNESILLEREHDNIQIKNGDTVLVQQGGSTEIALIKEIRFGNDNFLDVIVMWFIKVGDIDANDLPKCDDYRKENIITNEIFITSYLEEIKLSEIVNKVQVLSFKDFLQIVIDDSNVMSTFMTRRGTDSTGENFSEPFDWQEVLTLYNRDSNEFLDWIRQQTVPTAYKVSSSPTKKRDSVKQRLQSPRKSSTKRKLVFTEEEDVEEESDDQVKISDLDAEVDDDEDDDEEVIDEISEPENDDSDDIMEDEVEDETDRVLSNKRRKKQVTKSPRKSPRKAKSSTPQSQSGSPTKSTDKNGDKMSLQYMTSVLSPMKKGFKIKNDSKPKLALLSPSKPIKSKLRIDITSQAFTEIKAKLHTSARISSMPGREDEFLTIYAALEQTIQDEIGTCLYVSGTPGVGKTATIREVIAQLQESVRDNQIREFEYLEINGLKLLSPNVAYEKLWEKISGFKVSASNAAILLENYFKDPKQVKKPLVVLVDELDQIVTKKQNVMYNFFNWPTYEQSKFIVIAVANTMDLPERVLTNKISSRLGLNRIQFIGYGFDQLGTIIRHRLDMLTRENQRKVVINEDAIGFASRKVASVSGDARRALTICRRAVEIAERDFLSSRDESNETEDETFHVQINHISQAISETINSPLQQFLKSLPFASKLVLAATLLRNKRSGLAENPLGDIIDEMKNSLQMLTSKESNTVFAEIDSTSNIMQMFYSNQFLHKSDEGISIRLSKFKQILNELTEFGVLVQQNVPGERYKLIQLNVSAEEVNTALARDNDVGDLLRNINK